SHMIAKWFGTPVAGNPLFAWLRERDPAYSEWLEMALETVRERMLPVDVALGQLPKRLQVADCTYAVQYQLIGSANGVAPAADAPTDRNGVQEKILVIFTDITELMRKDASERHQAELLAMFERLTRDRAGFIEFMTETDDIMSSLCGEARADLSYAKRLIHTLKGNAAIFGMQHLSQLCHELENRIAEEGRAPSETDLATLQQTWARMRAELQPLIGERQHRSIEIDDEDYRAILQAVTGGADRQRIARMIEAWRLEPASKRLARIEEQLRGLAQRMGKSEVVVSVEPNGLRFNSERFVAFWSAFIHVLRNAVDYGVEERADRERSGKTEPPAIKVSTAMRDQRFVVTIEDNGPGVAWDALRDKARELGVDAEVLADPQRLICLPGLSSKTSVTELSGRGVGMTAVRDACEALGGVVKVESTRGAGTRISFIFPKDRAVYEGHAALLDDEPQPLAAAG
ncbi:MAG: ATP-binding protein, partial [Steroidobacteraceae bacterium]